MRTKNKKLWHFAFFYIKFRKMAQQSQSIEFYFENFFLFFFKYFNTKSRFARNNQIFLFYEEKCIKVTHLIKISITFVHTYFHISQIIISFC